MEYKDTNMIDQLIAEARQDLERQNFDAALEKFETATSIAMYDITKLLRRHIPVVRSKNDLLSRYFFSSNEDAAETITLEVDVAADSTAPTVSGLFSLFPTVSKATLKLNGQTISDPAILSHIAVRQPVRVVAIKYIKGDNLTLTSFLNVNVKYEYIGVWGQRTEATRYSLAEHQPTDNFKDSPLVVRKGLVLDGNTGITLSNLPAGGSSGYTLTLILYASAFATPGLPISGRRPPTFPKVPKIKLHGLMFDEE